MKILKTMFFITITIVVLTACSKANAEYVDISDCASGAVRFEYGDASVNSSLSSEDLSKIKAIINNHVIKTDSPSCGFTEKVSILLDDKYSFCIANDTCPIIYFHNKDKYLYLSDSENTQLRDILETYGFVFPCV